MTKYTIFRQSNVDYELFRSVLPVVHPAQDDDKVWGRVKFSQLPLSLLDIHQQSYLDISGQ